MGSVILEYLGWFLLIGVAYFALSVIVLRRSPGISELLLAAGVISFVLAVTRALT